MRRCSKTASADARDRVLGELTLRAGEVARHVSDRVSDAVLRDDPQMLNYGDRKLHA